MKQSVDYGTDDHHGDEDRPTTAWSVGIRDDCDTCEDIRVELILEEEGTPGTGVVAHLAPATAKRLRAALASALKDERATLTPNSVSGMPFKGWPAEAFEFFEGLEADNSKTYWHEHKHVYEQSVRAPMEALLEQLASEFGPGKVYRPYRDVRFSADKTPYKTAIGASNERGYVQLSAHGLASATGYWHMARDQLARYRPAVDNERTGKQLEKLTAGLRRQKYVVGGAGLKTAPRGFPKDHPRIELLRFTDMTVWQEWSPAAWMGTAKAADHITKVWRDAAALTDWLDTHVGASTEPGR